MYLWNSFGKILHWIRDMRCEWLDSPRLNEKLMSYFLRLEFWVRPDLAFVFVVPSLRFSSPPTARSDILRFICWNHRPGDSWLELECHRVIPKSETLPELQNQSPNEDPSEEPWIEGPWRPLDKATLMARNQEPDASLLHGPRRDFDSIQDLQTSGKPQKLGCGWQKWDGIWVWRIGSLELFENLLRSGWWGKEKEVYVGMQNVLGDFVWDDAENLLKKSAQEMSRFRRMEDKE